MTILLRQQAASEPLSDDTRQEHIQDGAVELGSLRYDAVCLRMGTSLGWGSTFTELRTGAQHERMIVTQGGRSAHQKVSSAASASLRAQVTSRYLDPSAG